MRRERESRTRAGGRATRPVSQRSLCAKIGSRQHKAFHPSCTVYCYPMAKNKRKAAAVVAEPDGKRKVVPCQGPPVPMVKPSEKLLRFAPNLSGRSVMVNSMLAKRFQREAAAEAQGSKSRGSGSSSGKNEHELEDATRWVTSTGMAHYLTLKTRASNGMEIFFKCRPTTLLEKLMDAYCFRANVDPHTVAFFKADEDGQPDQQLLGSSTPQSVGLEDNDVIHVIDVMF